MVSTIRFICCLIFILISSLLLISFFLFTKEKYEDDFVNFEEFSQISKEKKVDYKNKLLPIICSSHIYGIPIYKYIPFMNDAYYYNQSKKNSSSFHYQSYKNLFFEDEDLDIKVVGDLINSNKSESVRMIQYNITSHNVTIFSIKGTSNKNDIFLDMQLYIPSVFLNLLSTFSVFSQEADSYSQKIIEYALSIPYRLFYNESFINDYLFDLREAYNKSNKFDNVVIVGHSLGGGLSKILARIVKEQAISLSVPWD